MLSAMKHLSALFVLLLIAGCATGAPPSAVERAIYTVTTNWHTQIVPVAVFGTNNSIVATNYLTNIVAAYDLTPKESVVTGIQAGGTIGTMLGFGPSGAIATLVLGLLSAWAGWRSNRKGKLNVALAQGIETAREILISTSGRNVEKRFVEEVKSQQVEAGVKAEATKVSRENVNTSDAKDSAEKVMTPSSVPPSDSLPLP